MKKTKKKLSEEEDKFIPKTTSSCVSVFTASYFWFSSRSHTVLGDLKESNEIYNRRREDKKNFKKHKPFKQVSSDEKEDKLCDSQKIAFGIYKILEHIYIQFTRKGIEEVKRKKA